MKCLDTGNKNHKKWWVLLSIIIILSVILFIINYNRLSSYETVEKFIYLVSKSKYEEAKEYTTSNFEWDLSSVKKQKLEYADNFTYKYGNYYLEEKYSIAYITLNLKEIRAAEIIKFKLKKTMLGFKIDGYEIDWIEY